jgi:hypothetical protein
VIKAANITPQTIEMLMDHPRVVNKLSSNRKRRLAHQFKIKTGLKVQHCRSDVVRA